MGPWPGDFLKKSIETDQKLQQSRFFLKKSTGQNSLELLREIRQKGCEKAFFPHCENISKG
jgi:hypothetical protein